MQGVGRNTTARRPCGPPRCGTAHRWRRHLHCRVVRVVDAHRDVGVPLERRASQNGSPDPYHGADHTNFAPVLRQGVEALVGGHVPFALIGGLAVSCFGRPRWTHDIDVFVRPEDADVALTLLADRDFKTERTDPAWLFKAFKTDVMVDLIFFCSGGFYLEQEMIERRVWRELFGSRMPLLPPEDLLLLKAAVHDENGPRHWHDALGILGRTRLDWDYLLARAHRAPRRLLSLLVYAHSVDLAVPNEVIKELYRRVYEQ